MSRDDDEAGKSPDGDQARKRRDGDEAGKSPDGEARPESRGGEDRRRLVSVRLDEASIGRGNPDQEHERRVAIYDLLETNSFRLPGIDGGPYQLVIGVQEGKLVLSIASEAGMPVMTHLLSLKPFRSLVKDYLDLCDSYYAAIRTASPSRIEAIDMARRGLHDEGATLLGERLRRKIEADAGTLRRLFTLITALHWKG